MSSILRVKEAFASVSDPSGHVYTPGELVDSTHPIVKGREKYFEAVEVEAARRSDVVEQATAAPGEKRSVFAPKPAKKAAPATAALKDDN